MRIPEAFLDYKGRIMKSGYVKSVAVAAFRLNSGDEHAHHERDDGDPTENHR